MTDETKYIIDSLTSKITDHKEFMSEQFNEIKKDINETKELARSTERQAIKTNGRVSALEEKTYELQEKHKDCPAIIESVEIKKSISRLEKDLIGVHYIQKLLSTRWFRLLVQWSITALLLGSLGQLIHKIFFNTP